MIEAEALDAGDDLAELCIAELAGDRRCYDRVNLVVLILVAALDKVDSIENEGLIDDCAERALVDTGAAGDALFVINMRCAMLLAAHADGLNLAGLFARTLLVDDGAVRAYLCALAALYAFRLIDVRLLLLIKRDGAAAAYVLAAVCKTTAAGLCDDMTADRAFVAGNLDDFDDVRVFLVAAHSELDALLNDGALFVDAAAHRRFFFDDQLRNLIVCGVEVILKTVTCDLAQDLILQILDFRIKLSHSSHQTFLALDRDFLFYIFQTILRVPRHSIHRSYSAFRSRIP